MNGRKTSIENLTFVGQLTDELRDMLENSTYLKYVGYSRNYGFSRSYQGVNGGFFESGKEKCRIEFNPKTADCEEIKKFLSLLHNSHLTRLDVGIDYEGIDLSNYGWDSIESRKKYMWFDSDGVLETLYIGSSTSDLRFTVFNKISEQEDKGVELAQGHNPIHWKVKAQRRFRSNLKNQSMSDYLPFNLMDIYSYSKRLDLSSIENTKERLIVRGLLEEPNEFSYLSPKTRTKYRKIIKQLQKDANELHDLEPHEVYIKERDFLKEDLHYFDLY